MAARIDTRISDAHREKIQTSQLINRLVNHINTDVEDPDFKKKFMDKSQVSAALGLLKKTVPDLQAIQLSGELESKHFVISSSGTLPENNWLEQHGKDDKGSS